ncbi:MAG: SH3 domain-containing protein [Candidatus Binatia bacterium]
MKLMSFVLLLCLTQGVSTLPVYAGSSNLPQANKTTISLQSFATNNTSLLGSKWNFLRRPQGPSSDPISNGLIEQLQTALKEHQHLSVAAVSEEQKTAPLMRGLPPDPSVATSLPGESPRFLVSCSATMSGDLITIEVRLTDPKTKKLVKATTVEGRPEDLHQEIKGLLGESYTPISGQESPAEKAVRAAILKAATWIGANALESVIVKTTMTRVKEEPRLQSATLATVQQGTILRKVGQEGEWVHIRLDSGKTGWVYSEVVE